MKLSTFVSSALVVLASFATVTARADNMASIAIAPATGVVSLTPRWGIGGNLGGFHHMSQDLGLGGAANNFYSIKGTSIPAGGDILAFNLYTAASGAATPHADIGSKLTPSSYSALTSADPDIGYGSVNLYLIHHKGTTDYFTALIPGSAVASAVTDEKPMSGPGGPGTVTGVSGYFGLTFAAANLGYGLNLFYYLRTDPVTGSTKFGSLEPALLGTSADRFDLGAGGHKALAFTGTDVGYGTNKMYFLRLDAVTGFTILGTLHPTTGKASDIANLGSVYSTLTFVPGDVGFGSGQFYTTGSVNPTWQSVSFAALADRAISAGAFTVTPSASSGLPIALTVVAGSIGSATISTPVGGVFTVTPTAPGVITLQATQAGQAGLFESNMLRQSFTASGVATVPTVTITTQPSAQSVVAGSTVNFTVAATSSTALTYQWRKAGANISGNASATTSTLTLANVQASDTASYDVLVANASSSVTSAAATLTVTAAAPVVPVITNPAATAAGTIGTPFSFAITASQSPTSYAATGLPAGLTLNASTGVISGTPTTSGTSVISFSATNSAGTASGTLTLTVASASVAPVITSPTTAAAAAGTSFTYQIAATGSPTSYAATGLPAGLTLNTSTGVISGTPTNSGTSVISFSATNSAGTTSGTLTLTVAAASGAPVITSSTTAAGAAGTPFVSYQIAASGSPTSYTATGLPAGLTLNTTTGLITGTPTTAGTSVVTLTATNSSGTSTSTLTITVAAVAATTPQITGSMTAAGSVGTPFATYQITATGGATSYTATNLPPGLAVNAQTGAITGTPTVENTWFVALGATNSAGTGTSTLMIVIGAAGSVVVPVPTPEPSSRIVNFSARAMSGAGSQTLIMGFVVKGNGKNLLVRGIGPGLAAYGVTNALVDPMLTLYGPAGAMISTNDDWQTTAVGQPNGTLVAATALRVGAFALPDGSKDSSLLYLVNDGAHTTSMLRPNSTSGIALTEIYDTDVAAGASLINVSARMDVTAGNGVLIAGLAIAGNAPKTLVIRGVGPGLTPFGVTAVLADPVITVFSGSTQIATNDNWEAGANTATTAQMAQVGAFALVAGSKDAALRITLQPGSYTVHVQGLGGTTGVALIEIYDAQ